MSQGRRFSLCTSQHFRRATTQHVARTNWKCTNVERTQNAFDSTDKHHNLSIFQWRLLFLVGRMSREFDTCDTYCAIFFFLTGGTRCCISRVPVKELYCVMYVRYSAIPLHGALHTGYSNEVPSSFSSWREAWADHSDKRCSLA